MDQATYTYNAKSTHAHTPAEKAPGLPLPAANVARHPVTLDLLKADQELVRLSAEHVVNRRALLECPLDPDESPHWPPYAATHGAISNARPRTLAELAAKARAAKGEAIIGTGNEDPLNGSALEWAWDIVNDLIRLDGENV